MAEWTTGIYRLVGIPAFYKTFQNALGAKAGRKRLVSDFIRPESGEKFLDLGCGSAEILRELPDDVTYCGVDRNAKHIAEAQATYGSRGRFLAGDFGDAVTLGEESFDAIFAFGLLHHLDDTEAKALMTQVRQALAENGRFLTIDPVITDNQPFAAKWLIQRDSGRNVRRLEEYERLADGQFGIVNSEVRSDLLRVPYTHCLIECR